MPVRSPYPDVDLPAVSLPEFLFGNDPGEHAALPALVDGVTSNSLTFGELREQVARVAAALAERGIGRGDVVALPGAAGRRARPRRRPPAGCRVTQGYGMTELSPVTHCVPDGVDLDVATVGRLLPNMEAMIVDPATDAELPPGERGELWCRGPNVMAGYLNDPDATAAALDGDGWLHTGIW